MTVKQNLIAARALIDTPEKWIKGSISNGEGRYCTMGAVGRVARGPFGWISNTAEYQALRAALPAISKSIPSFNDHPDTTHADIMALFDRAIAACED